MNDVAPQPELMTVADVAAQMQVSTRQVYLMEADGRLGPLRVQVGRAVRFRRSDVQAWIEAGCPRADAWRHSGEGYDG